MKIDYKKPHHWLLLVRQGIFTIIATLLRPFTSKPDRPIVLLYGHQFAGNLKALYEEWQTSDNTKFDLYFLTLNPEEGKILRKRGIAALECGKLSDMLILRHASAMVTDGALSGAPSGPISSRKRCENPIRV